MPGLDCSNCAAKHAHLSVRRYPRDGDGLICEVAAELGRTLDFVKVPKREKDEALAAFAAHKNEVIAGYVAKHS